MNIGKRVTNPATCTGTKARHRPAWWIFWRRTRICRAAPSVCPAAAPATMSASLPRRALRRSVLTSRQVPIRLADGKTDQRLPDSRLKFQLADFLHDEPPQKFDWLFEHTLFCAIKPQERDDYVRAALRWLKPDGQYLAVNYLIPDKDGPPFGTTREELWRRFSPHFELVEELVPRSYPNRTGLELLLWWRRKVR